MRKRKYREEQIIGALKRAEQCRSSGQPEFGSELNSIGERSSGQPEFGSELNSIGVGEMWALMRAGGPFITGKF